MKSADPDMRPSTEEALQSILSAYRSLSRDQLDTSIPEPKFVHVPEDVQLAAYKARVTRTEARNAVGRAAETEEFRRLRPFQESLPFFYIIPYALLAFSMLMLSA